MQVAQEEQEVLQELEDLEAQLVVLGELVEQVVPDLVVLVVPV